MHQYTDIHYTRNTLFDLKKNPIIENIATGFTESFHFSWKKIRDTIAHMEACLAVVPRKLWRAKRAVETDSLVPDFYESSIR
ncbi:MAG: hypothetical protein NUV53_03015 [Patescibacteria group bacterium]|nr:hypothetical protein [Patescibacteria group bacterium]